MEARQPTADSQHILMEIEECAVALAISPDNPATIQVGNSLINSICWKIGALPQLPSRDVTVLLKAVEETGLADERKHRLRDAIADRLRCVKDNSPKIDQELHSIHNYPTQTMWKTIKKDQAPWRTKWVSSLR